jgi:hypothetical protein
MSMPILNQGVITVQSVAETFSDAKTATSSERGADAASTARAIVVVSFTGAGFWFVLWKMALLLVAGH